MNKPGATSVDVAIDYNIGTIPNEFVTVLMIDHGTLPAFEVTNIGPSPTGSHTVTIALDAAGKATRFVSFVATRSQVQTMAFPKDFNIVALTVLPESTVIGDVFKFAGPDRLSLRNDANAQVFFVNAWDPKAGLPIDQRAGTPVTLFTTDHLIPGQGYMVLVVTLAGLPRDHMLIIPGAPPFATGRGS